MHRGAVADTQRKEKIHKNTRTNINSIDKINNKYNYYYYMLVRTFDGFNLESRQKLLYKLYCSTRYISNLRNLSNQSLGGWKWRSLCLSLWYLACVFPRLRSPIRHVLTRNCAETSAERSRSSTTASSRTNRSYRLSLAIWPLSICGYAPLAPCRFCLDRRVHWPASYVHWFCCHAAISRPTRARRHRLSRLVHRSLSTLAF